MKHLIYIIFSAFSVAFVLMIFGCNKIGDIPSAQNGQLAATSQTAKNGQLVASSQTVKINQPDSLLLVGATDSIHWSIVPSGFDSLVHQKNAAVIFFKKSGTYKVTATGTITPAATVSIKVTDSVYNKNPTFTVIPLTGDQITLVPYYYSSFSADSTYITLVAQTHHYYCGSSRLNVTDSLINNNYGIDFLNVTQSSSCVIGDSPIAAVIKFTGQAHKLQNGTFPLSASLNGQTYTGSIVVTSTTITFNWDYSSGILISPKQIKR